MKKQLKNSKNGKVIPAIHGENFLLPVTKVPDGEFIEHKKFVIAHSESGHNHVLISDTPFAVMEETEKHDLYVRLFEPTQLVHEKTFDIHETETLMPGDYAVFHKSEYDPFAEVVGKVRD